MILNFLACNFTLKWCSLVYLQLQMWKEMHFNTHTHSDTHTVFMPNHCCRYWNIETNGRARSLQHFFGHHHGKKKKKKTWAISVDSTILVNGYHIYSTACYYNSSVSNLGFTCSQVFLRLPIFRHLSARPQSVSGERAGKHTGRGPSSLHDR